VSRNKINLLIGILVAAMPFLGFPAQWKTIFYVVAGAILIISAVLLHIRRRSVLNLRREQHIVTDVFVENGKLSQVE
jgi:hypothetical protein